MAPASTGSDRDIWSVLCPRCGRAASPLCRICPGCGSRLRSVLIAALLSMALPGMGHLYLGRRALAACEFAGGLALFGLALVCLAGVFLAVLDERAPLLDLLRTCLPWAFILACYSVADGVFTLLVSRRWAARENHRTRVS